MRDDEWIHAAISDDSMVAELLMRLKESDTLASQPLKSLPVVFRAEWGVRLPRSRQHMKKDGESMRASPTTPLSWSAGTSPSGGGGGGSGSADGGGGAGNGYEESSRPVKLSTGGRSKVTTANGTFFRPSRKKKTFAELKEEHSLLLKERIYLKKEMATVRVSFKEERARNKSLKRMKLLLQLESTRKTVTASDASERAISGQPHLTEAATIDHTSTILPRSVIPNVPIAVSCPSPFSNSYEKQVKDVKTEDSFFMLPDLNLPVEEDAVSEILYGMS